MTLFRISQAAELVGVSDDTIRRNIELGRLPASLDESRRKVIDGVDLAAFLKAMHPLPEDPLKVASSARNRLVGVVTSVTTDAIMAQVEVQCGPHRIVSLVSREAVEDLGLEPGSLAVAMVKSTDVTVELSA
ncbi:TOBE domain-containing protein [Pseudonocardia pini]|uniref:TOBE domain-containing protein n=1 Tax=Pseudonocardia pini TaxID=2758030 RepID=UPI0015F0175E|nr:TOBE domain-containing protein [Pseudonocardia pini]